MEIIYFLMAMGFLYLVIDAFAKFFAREEYESWDTMYEDVLTLARIMGFGNRTSEGYQIGTVNHLPLINLGNRIKEVKHVHGLLEEYGADQREDGELMINMLYYFLAIELLREIDPDKYGPELTRQIRWVKTTEIPRVEWKLKVAVQTELRNISEPTKLIIHEDPDLDVAAFSLD